MSGVTQRETGPLPVPHINWMNRLQSPVTEVLLPDFPHPQSGRSTSPVPGVPVWRRVDGSEGSSLAWGGSSDVRWHRRRPRSSYDPTQSTRVGGRWTPGFIGVGTTSKSIFPSKLKVSSSRNDVGLPVLHPSRLSSDTSQRTQSVLGTSPLLGPSLTSYCHPWTHFPHLQEWRHHDVRGLWMVSYLSERIQVEVDRWKSKN